MIKNFFKSITIVEWVIWTASVSSMILFFILFQNTEYVYLIGSLLGATALIFISKGNPIGQVLTILFCVFYGIIAYSYQYYGEMITYLGMCAPTAVWSLVSWLKHPYKDHSQVRVNSLSCREWTLFLLLSAGGTAGLFFVLRALHTANLIISTLSVLTSFVASYLSARRSRFYAVGYGLNDLVLIAMWAMACAEDLTYLPVVLCFVAFLTEDIYGFVNWSRMAKRQKEEK